MGGGRYRLVVLRGREYPPFCCSSLSFGIGVIASTVCCISEHRAQDRLSSLSGRKKTIQSCWSSSPATVLLQPVNMIDIHELKRLVSGPKSGARSEYALLFPPLTSLHKCTYPQSATFATDHLCGFFPPRLRFIRVEKYSDIKKSKDIH